MTEYVLPNDTNTLGNLMGGQLMHWMDICAAMTAQRHTNRVCVTASVDSVDFRSPIRLGEIVNLESVVNRAFNTSLEVQVDVWAEDPLLGTRRKCNTAYFTFVAVDDNYKKTLVPQLAIQTEEQHQRYEGALRRRELRLVMAGRMNLDEAHDLRSTLLQASAAEQAGDS
jgi:acyl-CoA hydrolase